MLDKILKIVGSLVVLGIVGLIFKSTWVESFTSLGDEHAPCSKPLSYSIEGFDSRFNISKDDFLSAVKSAENSWEEATGKDLFVYKKEGRLKINLIYDERQETTQKLKEIDAKVGNDKAYYNRLKSKYDTLSSEYNNIKNSLNRRVATFNSLKVKYEAEVSKINSQGGAGEEDYNRLNKEKISLEAELANINKIGESLNSKAKEINALGSVLNKLVHSLNLKVKEFNTVGSEFGDEFEEGTYQVNKEGERIDIYQFEDRAKLIRVLEHEFGHAIGLGHIENAEAVMYRFNNGINGSLTKDDIDAFKQVCEVNE